ncbi:hypothetical protein K466DRAFT_595433 [Polyporus arcularius HHB13444]|uniref:Uncharacterized protein n=1 Tax=Polyporus arcularius HHB13444 TaxID=1314778 RepID=A0A5C3PRC8_9APHY|nr:hypothetical protein K466DRAFT_595433 [Polyporus arcularius HHB13444]
MNQNRYNQSNARGSPMAFFPGQVGQGQGLPMPTQQPHAQPPGMQFVWPGPGWPHMTMNGQQWPQLPMQGGTATQMAHFAPGPSGPSAAEIAVAVAAAMRQESSYTPAGSDPEDERILITALKKGYAEGLTTRPILMKLHNVNNHTESSWRDFYLDHDKRLLSKIYGFAIPSSLTTRRDGGRDVADLPSRHHPGTGSQSQPSRSLSSKRRDPDNMADSSPLPQRSKRGGPVDEYHAGTYIPPFCGSKKPKAPRRIFGDERFKFRDEDKIFLIHYLRWRVQQGEVPGKLQVFEELAQQTHHSADAWKRHWQQNAELPDRLLAQAKKRSAEEQLEPEPSRDEEGEGEEDEGGEDDDDGEESPGDEASAQDMSQATRGDRAHTRRRRRSGRVTLGVKVTEDDLRAMAQYKAERLDAWSDFPSKQGAWQEFYERPGNEKRSLNAWFCAARDHAEELREYLQEYLADEQESQSDKELQPTPPLSSSRAVSQQTEPKVTTLGKRHAEPTNESDGVAPAAKRARQEADIKHDGPNLEPKAEDVKEDEDEPEVIEIPRP